MKKIILLGIVLAIISCFIFRLSNKLNINPTNKIGEVIDSLNHVVVFYNGGVGHVSGRNVVDGYNVGLNYQCVEFVKRYYLEHYNHKMPDSYGHAISFFDPAIADGGVNARRALTQFTNPSTARPKVGDLIVMNATARNKFGHVAIVAEVTENKIELIQQNAGTFASTRVRFGLRQKGKKWQIKNERILGWLRK